MWFQTAKAFPSWIFKHNNRVRHQLVQYLQQKVCDTLIPTACCQHQRSNSFGSCSIYIHTSLQQKICNVVMSNIGRIHKRGPSTLVFPVQIQLRSEKDNRHWINKMYTKRNATGLASITYFWMHSAATSYWPMEQAVCRSRGTSSSSDWTRESPSHRERLEPSCSDSLASSLSSDIFQIHSPTNTTTVIRGQGVFTICRVLGNKCEKCVDDE